MKYRIIKIQQLQDIKSIITMSETVPGGVYIHHGRYVVDASSIMGIMSIDLTDPVKIEYPASALEFDKFIAAFEV